MDSSRIPKRTEKYSDLMCACVLRGWSLGREVLGFLNSPTAREWYEKWISLAFIKGNQPTANIPFKCHIFRLI